MSDFVSEMCDPKRAPTEYIPSFKAATQFMSSTTQAGIYLTLFITYVVLIHGH